MTMIYNKQRLKEKRYYVYIGTNHPRHTVLYTGVTSGLMRRDGQHRSKVFKNSFSAKYNINRIVYFEIYGDVHMALEREKEIKGWTRQKKINLINNANPLWKDLIKLTKKNNPEIETIINKIENNLQKPKSTCHSESRRGEESRDYRNVRD